MIEVYKLLTGREQIDCKQFFKPAQDHYGLRGHGMKLTKERSRLDTRKFFFSQCVVNGWNRLPAAVVNAETVNAFKNAYDHNYKSDMDNRSQWACRSINPQVQVQVQETYGKPWVD